MSDPAKSIRIGTMVSASAGKAAERIAEIADLGFESFEPFFWQTTNGQDLAELGKRSLDAIGNRDITISTLGMFGNPLEDTEMDRQTHEKIVIDQSHGHAPPSGSRVTHTARLNPAQSKQAAFAAAIKRAAV